MTPGIGKLENDIREGNSCLLSVMNQYFMVDLVAVGEETIRVSFPGRDYPIEGMSVDLEFHDNNGFDSYRTQVVVGPDKSAGSIVLVRPTEPMRNQHRDSCRVPTDLTVQVKDQVHVRRYDASLINLSAGGALLGTDAPFDFSTTVEISLSLPGEATHSVLGHVMHIAEGTPEAQGLGGKLVGARFVGLDPAASRSLNRFIWQRLRDLYAA
jgi:PilZ domain